MSIMVNKDTKVLVQGITGKTAAFHTRQMLDYGTNIVAGVTPGKAGMEVEGVPVYNSVADAVAATGATAVSQAITAGNNAYTDILKAEAFLDEDKAPVEGRVLFVTPGYYNTIKEYITTTMHADTYSSKLISRGYVGELDGIPVVKVPTSYFPTKTNAVLWHRDALLGAKQIMNTRIKTDSELVDGTLLLGRFIYGSFVLNGKKKSVASIVSGS